MKLPEMVHSTSMKADNFAHIRLGRGGYIMTEIQRLSNLRPEARRTIVQLVRKALLRVQNEETTKSKAETRKNDVPRGGLDIKSSNH